MSNRAIEAKAERIMETLYPDGEPEMSDPTATPNTHDEESITMSMTLGTILTGARARSGLTLREAAAQINIDYTYLSKLEHDACKPPSDIVLTAFAFLYLIDDDLLFTLAGKVPPDLRQDVVSYHTVKRIRAMLVDPTDPRNASVVPLEVLS